MELWSLSLSGAPIMCLLSLGRKKEELQVAFVPLKEND